MPREYVSEERAEHSSKRRRRRTLTRWSSGVLLWALAIIFLIPFVWMVSTSLKNNADAFKIPVQWIPDPVRWHSYVDVLTGEGSIVRPFVNSVIVAVVRVIGELTTATMAGYAFARLHFKGRDAVFFIYLATSTVPAQLLLVPRFVIFQQVGLYDTLLSLILPGMFTVLGTFLMRQFFVAQPAEFADAARVDGASEWKIFSRVYLPLAGPMLSALGILTFVWSWNDYETPLVMISSEKTYTLPLALSNFVDDQGAISANLTMAASVVSVIPILIIFLLLQRHFIAAITSSGIKG